MGNNESVQQEGFGYQVIEVKANSPVERAGLEIFLDFIIGVHDDSTNSSNQQLQFFKLIESKEDQEISLKIRNVKAIPSRSWPNADSLLGALLRHESYKSYQEKTFKIMNVLKNSPAQEGGFQQDTDYIIGLVKYRYNNLEQLIDKIQISANEELEFGLYNIKEGKVRIGKLKLNNKWGGQGLMGCQLGSGLLNQLVFDPEQNDCVQKEIVSPVKKEILLNMVQQGGSFVQTNQKNLKQNLQNSSSVPLDEKNEKFVEHFFNGFLRYNNSHEINENETLWGSFSFQMDNSGIQNCSIINDSLVDQFSSNRKTNDSINFSQDQLQLNLTLNDEFIESSQYNKSEVRSHLTPRYYDAPQGEYKIDSKDLFQLDVQIIKKAGYINDQ